MIWEYQAITVDAKGIWSKNLNTKNTVKDLNELGKEGWEVVAAIPIERTGAWTREVQTYAFGFILKRPKPN